MRMRKKPNRNPQQKEVDNNGKRMLLWRWSLRHPSLIQQHRSQMRITDPPWCFDNLQPGDSLLSPQ